MVIAGTLPPIRGLFLFPAQLIAAMCAGALVQAMVPGDIGATNTSLSPGVSVAQGVFIEMFMTAYLVFVVLMLAAEKSKDTFMAPIGIGLALFVAMMGGKLLSNIACLSVILMLTFVRRLLHRRFPQPCSKPWPRRCFHAILPLPLDLLGWSVPGCRGGCWILSICEVLRLRTGQSWTRLCWRRL